MFWRKKEEVRPSRFIKIIEPRCRFGHFIERAYPGYKDEGMKEAKRLAFYEDVQKLDSKLNLILKELGKEYVPESSKTEPAKLKDISEIEQAFPNTTFFVSFIDNVSTTKPKKKRGRPKTKK